MCKYTKDEANERCKDGGAEVISRKVTEQVIHTYSVCRVNIQFYLSLELKFLQYNNYFQADKDEIVKKHNELRARVANGEETLGQPTGTGQPKAANMRQLVWNDELAEVAQR